VVAADQGRVGNCNALSSHPNNAREELVRIRREMDNIATQVALAAGTAVGEENKSSVGCDPTSAPTPLPDLTAVERLIRGVDVVLRDLREEEDRLQADMLAGCGYSMIGDQEQAFPRLMRVAEAAPGLVPANDQVTAIMMVLPVLRKQVSWAQIVAMVDKTKALAGGTWLDASLPFVKGVALFRLSADRAEDAAALLEQALDLNPGFQQAYVEFENVVGWMGDFERCRRVAQRSVDYGGHWVSCWQRPPHFLRLDCLASAPWHNAQTFQIARDLEAGYSAIRAELDALLAGGTRQWGIVGSSDQRGSDLSAHDGQLVASGEWREVVLLGDNCEKNRSRCPETCRILDSCSEVREAARLRIGESLFSQLAPGTRLAAHCGPTNLRLTCHLPLIIPERCSITCGGETRVWEEGRCIVFDDSYEHEVSHQGDLPRVVLLVNFFHPGLPTECWESAAREASGSVA